MVGLYSWLRQSQGKKQKQTKKQKHLVWLSISIIDLSSSAVIYTEITNDTLLYAMKY